MKNTLTKIAILGLIGLGLLGYSRSIVRAEQEASEPQKLENITQTEEDPAYVKLIEKGDIYKTLLNNYFDTRKSTEPIKSIDDLPDEIKKAKEESDRAFNEYLSAELSLLGHILKDEKLLPKSESYLKQEDQKTKLK